jgi:hypothetical protein
MKKTLFKFNYKLLLAYLGVFLFIFLVLISNSNHKQGYQTNKINFTQNYDSFKNLLLANKKPLSQRDLIRAMNTLISLEDEGKTKYQKEQELDETIIFVKNNIQMHSKFKIEPENLSEKDKISK